MKIYKRKLKNMSLLQLKEYVAKNRVFLSKGDMSYIEALMEDHRIKNEALAEKIVNSYPFKLGRISAIRKGLAQRFTIGEGVVRHEVDFGVALVGSWTIIIKAMKKGIRIAGNTQVEPNGKPLE